MKLTFLLLIAAIYLTYADRSNQLLLRNLDEIGTNNLIPRLIILGFGNYYKERDSFSFYLQNENNSTTNFKLPLKINFTNNTSSKINGSCDFEEKFEYYCTIPFDIENISTISVENWEYIKKEFNVSDDQLIISPLANETMLNIQNQTKSMDFDIFELKNIIIINENFTLNGNILDLNKTISNKTDLELLLSNQKFICSLVSLDDLDKISCFAGEKKINDKIHLKMLNKSCKIYENKEHYILILADKNDYVLYSKSKNSFIEFLGSAYYESPKQTQRASTQVIFKGTHDNFKKFIRFPVQINFMGLRFLQGQPIKTNATGERFINSLEADKGIVRYNITFLNTENLTNILNIVPIDEFEFADNQDFSDSVKKSIIHRKEYNLTNKGEFKSTDFNVFNLRDKHYSPSSFSFDINNLPLTDKKNFNITKNKTYLSYVSMEDSKLDEIECFIINKTSFYTIDCAPKKSVYTFLKTVEINIPYLETKRRLRFLDETNNITLFPPADDDGCIEFDYNPEINTFGKKYNKNKGLSPGAIVAIVFATVAAVAAVAVAIFFLNRMPSSPVKPQTEMNLQNSSANINK